jgi:hypothetical protein
MKISKLFLIAIIKICFVLFGIIPLVSVILFGTLPTFSVVHFAVNWIGIEYVVGFGLFLTYLVVSAVFDLSKNRTRYPSMKIFS